MTHASTPAVTPPAHRQLPIIDLSAADRGPRARALLHAQLHSAAHDVGFFQLIGHGVTRQETDLLLTAMRRFFALPEAERLALDNVHSPTSAATPAPATSAPAAGATGATSSTSAPSGRPGSRAPGSRRTGGWRGPTSGPRRCRSCARPRCTGSSG